jgi:hypothetical protein
MTWKFHETDSGLRVCFQLFSANLGRLTEFESCWRNDGKAMEIVGGSFIWNLEELKRELIEKLLAEKEAKYGK